MTYVFGLILWFQPTILNQTLCFYYEPCVNSQIQEPSNLECCSISDKVPEASSLASTCFFLIFLWETPPGAPVWAETKRETSLGAEVPAQLSADFLQGKDSDFGCLTVPSRVGNAGTKIRAHWDEPMNYGLSKPQACKLVVGTVVSDISKNLPSKM